MRVGRLWSWGWDRLSDGGQDIVRGWLEDRYGLCWQIVPAVFFEIIPDPD